MTAQETMQINHWVQVDADDGSWRFWMDSCGGRDQVAMTLLHSGWRAYEAPLPALLESWCAALEPVFIDVGANTGYYALLALACGAPHAYAFEPVLAIATVLTANARMSELSARLSLYDCALGKSEGKAMLYLPHAGHGLVETSASLNPNFRAHHAGQLEVRVARLDSLMHPMLESGREVLLKIDVESAEPAVLEGASGLIDSARPAIVCEILPGSDIDWFERFCIRHGYRHFALQEHGLVEGSCWPQSLAQRDHLFLPEEKAARWLDALTGQKKIEQGKE